MRMLITLACEFFLLSLLGFSASMSAQGTQVHCSGSLTPIGRAFDNAIDVIESKTPMPPRLPRCIFGLDSSDELYSIVKSADEGGYVVVLGATPNCQGQHVCSYGTMIGTSRPFNQIDDAYDVARRPRTPVKLHHELHGYFYASVCGAYCSDSFVTWTEGTYHYMIGLKAEKKSNLIASVNSAIDGGSRWK